MRNRKYNWVDVVCVWFACFCLYLLTSPDYEVKLYHNAAWFFRKCAYEFGRAAIFAEAAYWDAIERIKR